MKLTKTGEKKYQIKIGKTTYKITPDNYSYYLQYNLVAYHNDGSITDYSSEHMPNLKTVKEFIKTL